MEEDLSIEGGVRGHQRRLVCPKCGKVFFAWRPDELPGQKIKCYFCRHEFADEAALRPVPTPLPAPAPATPAPANAATAKPVPTPAPPTAETPPAEPTS